MNFKNIIMPRGDLAKFLEVDLENAKREVEDEARERRLKEKNETSKPKKTKKKASKVKQHALQMSPTELYENIQAHKKEIALKDNQGKNSVFIYEEYHDKLMALKLSKKINMTDAINYFLGYFLDSETYDKLEQKFYRREIR